MLHLKGQRWVAGHGHAALLKFFLNSLAPFVCTIVIRLLWKRENAAQAEMDWVMQTWR